MLRPSGRVEPLVFPFCTKQSTPLTLSCPNAASLVESVWAMKSELGVALNFHPKHTFGTPGVGRSCLDSADSCIRAGRVAVLRLRGNVGEEKGLKVGRYEPFCSVLVTVAVLLRQDPKKVVPSHPRA